MTGGPPTDELSGLGPIKGAVEDALNRMNNEHWAQRLNAKDGSLWSADAAKAAKITQWLGWLNVAGDIAQELEQFDDLSAVVYAIYNKRTEEAYIGSTRHLERRVKTHQNDLRLGRHPNQRLQLAWETCGARGFEVMVLAEVAEDDRYAEEQRFMDALGGRAYNYNSSKGQRLFTATARYRPKPRRYKLVLLEEGAEGEDDLAAFEHHLRRHDRLEISKLRPGDPRSPLPTLKT